MREPLPALTGKRGLPGRFMGKQMRDLFLCGGPSLVLARRHIQSAWAPLVVHIFPPLITYSSPSFTALVVIPGWKSRSLKLKLSSLLPNTMDHSDKKIDPLETSEPAPTSLTPRQATTSPAMEGRRNCCFSSSEPNLHPKQRNQRNLYPASETDGGKQNSCVEAGSGYLARAGVAMSVWTPMAMGMPPQRMLPSSSDTAML